MSKPVTASAALLMFALLAALQPPMATAADALCTSEKKAANLDFTLASITGSQLRLNDYKGQVILLNFWATWCAPCGKEIPWLIELHDKYRERGVAILGVSVDEAVFRTASCVDAPERASLPPVFETHAGNTPAAFRRRW